MAGPLAKKLLLKEKMRGAVLDAPAGYRRALDAPAGATVGSNLVAGLDFVQVFAEDATSLERRLPEIASVLGTGSVLWICYRKGGRKAGTDLSRDALWELAKRHGLIGVTLVALDETWSAMRFRRPEEVGH